MQKQLLLCCLLVVMSGCGKKAPETTSLPEQEPSVTKLTILHPFNEAVFPSDIRSPEIRWADPSREHKAWSVRISSQSETIEVVREIKNWTPPKETWEKIKGWTGPLTLSVVGLHSKDGQADGDSAEITFSISRDPVGAPVFFRAVPNPFPDPPNFHKVKWKIAWLSSYDPPKVVMKEQPKCFNCHVLSADGSTLGFEYNFKGDQKDRGGYLVTRAIGRKVVWQKEDFFDWNLYLPEADRERYQAFLSIISPNGDYVVTSGADYMGVDVIPIRDAIGYQLPTKGILLVYSLKDKTIKPLPGADDPKYVHVPTSWSADGKYIIFSRAPITPVFEKLNQEDGREAHRHEQTSTWRELDERYGGLIADIYRIPFNDGKGGVPEPVKGASGNGKCNYFGKISPDGRWIAFTQSAGGGYGGEGG